MKGERLLLSIAGAVLISAAATILGLQELFALITAIFAHELGHYVMIIALGLDVTNVHIEASGLRLDYVGLRSPLKDVLSAFAGPAAGIIYYALVSAFNQRIGSSVLDLSSQLSILYSLFNLLPIMPLDGGRIMYGIAEKMLGETEAERISNYVSKLLSIVFALSGLFCMLKGEGNGMFAAGLWLLLLQS